MSVTIQEVAEAAGVSKATVSKVLHKSYSISQETCDRVNEVIKELGYQPNRRAQSFATGATKTILFLAEMQHGVGFDNPHLFEIMAGVENALSEKGMASLCNTARRLTFGSISMNCCRAPMWMV